MIFPCVPPWGLPVPVGVPLPYPGINVLGIKVNENDTTSAINVGPSSIVQPNTNNKTNSISQILGDWGYAPVWGSIVNDMDGTDMASWTPQGYL
jgi:hypothetical protein